LSDQSDQSDPTDPSDKKPLVQPRKTNSPAVPISSGLCGDGLQLSRGKIRGFTKGRGGGR